MEVFKSRAHITKPKTPHIHSNNGIQGFFGYLFSIIMWILLLVIFVVTIYTQWFSRSVYYLLNLFQKKHYRIPFWFSLLMVIFFFPVTLVIIAISTLIKIIKE